MKEEKIKVIIKRTGEAAKVEEIENSLKSFQNIVGGHIEMPTMPNMRNANIIINDEGKILGLDPNFYIYDKADIICGNAVIAGNNNRGETISLTDKQIEQVMKYIQENAVTDFDGYLEDYADVEVFSGSDQDFFKALFGAMFDDSNNIKPEFKKEPEM